MSHIPDMAYPAFFMEYGKYPCEILFPMEGGKEVVIQKVEKLSYLFSFKIKGLEHPAEACGDKRGTWTLSRYITEKKDNTIGKCFPGIEVPSYLFGGVACPKETEKRAVIHEFFGHEVFLDITGRSNILLHDAGEIDEKISGREYADKSLFFILEDKEFLLPAFHMVGQFLSERVDMTLIEITFCGLNKALDISVAVNVKHVGLGHSREETLSNDNSLHRHVVVHHTTGRDIRMMLEIVKKVCDFCFFMNVEARGDESQGYLS
jgi:hypothetical protein